jgi:putative membrane protein
MITEKTQSYVIIVTSIAVPVLVAALFFISPPAIKHSIDLAFFPKFHALLNSLTAACLISGVYFIRRKNIRIHRAFMLTAFLLSTVFLVSYVIYHSISESTPYGGAGILRTVYFIILLSHILLATLILPLILFTFSRALNNKIEAHRKLARWTYPLWLYVAVSGVIVYFMISPYYTY